MNGVVALDTTRVPIGVNLFFGRSFYVRAVSTFVDQTGLLQRTFGTTQFPLADRFWVTDLGVNWLLPFRHGRVGIAVKNLFDRRSQYQEIDPSFPQLSPRRFVYGVVSLQF
jgi:hypothetical protein